MPTLTFETAEKALKTAQAKARELNAPMSVCVLDEGGNLVLAARGDGTGILTPDIARAKAYTSVVFKRATKVMAEGATANPSIWSSIASSTGAKILVVGGGVPVLVGGQIIGAIGCSGGTADQDHICAEAAAATLGK